MAAAEVEQLHLRPIIFLSERMTADHTDEQLLKSAVSGDSEAFGLIVRRWERKIFGLCFGMLGHEDQARDAVQETFIAAYRNISGFRGEAKVSSWLHRIAVNQCLSAKRRTKSRSEDFLDDADESETAVFVANPSGSPANLSESAERAELVKKAVQSLPAEFRQVVVMKEFEELTFAEISEALELPLSTVKSRLYTALKQLRQKLDRLALQVE